MIDRKKLEDALALYRQMARPNDTGTTLGVVLEAAEQCLSTLPREQWVVWISGDKSQFDTLDEAISVVRGAVSSGRSAGIDRWRP